jgi:hypothetical protein
VVDSVGNEIENPICTERSEDKLLDRATPDWPHVCILEAAWRLAGMAARSWAFARWPAPLILTVYENPYDNIFWLE